MLNSSIGMSNVINFFIQGQFSFCSAVLSLIVDGLDDWVWIWYYDRQGCVQSQGFNFVQDFLTFLVLLCAFQRFTLSNWGHQPTLDLRPLKAHLPDHPLNSEIRTDPESIENHIYSIPINENHYEVFTRAILHSTYEIIGRGTVTVLAKQKSTGKWVVLKLSWPESVRCNEATTIRDAREAASGDLNILNHLPEVLDWADLSLDTEAVRVGLGLKLDNELLPRPRLLRVIIFPYLDRITSLEGKDFVRAWLECVRCKACFGPDQCRPSSNIS